MAMRPIRNTVVVPSRRRPVVRPIYEDFNPVHEWSRQDITDTLLVHLPGFVKEEIKVTTEDRNIVRVRGERLLTGNKWSRFQEDFLVPEYCDMRGIRAKFDGGILAVTMPRKIIATVVAPKVDATPRIRTKQDISPPKPIQTPRNNQEADNRIIPDPQALASAFSANLEKQGKTQKDIRSADVDAEKEKEKSDGPKSSIPQPPPTKASDDGDIPRVYVPTSSIVDREKQRDRKTSLDQKQGDHHKSSEAAAAAAAAMSSQIINATGKTKDMDKGKEPIDEAASSVAEKIKANPNHNTNVTSSSLAINKLEEYKKMVAKGLGEGRTEERELLVNMGVAILVIVAFGAYVSYTTFGSSSGKA